MDVRLIDANSLIEAICKKCQENYCKPDATDTVSGCLIYDVIASAPTVDTQPVRYGKWVETVVRGTQSIYCSMCGSESPVCYPLNFCPDCGAEMCRGDTDGDQV